MPHGTVPIDSEGLFSIGGINHWSSSLKDALVVNPRLAMSHEVEDVLSSANG